MYIHIHIFIEQKPMKKEVTELKKSKVEYIIGLDGGKGRQK